MYLTVLCVWRPKVAFEVNGCEKSECLCSRNVQKFNRSKLHPHRWDCDRKCFVIELKGHES